MKRTVCCTLTLGLLGGLPTAMLSQIPTGGQTASAKPSRDDQSPIQVLLAHRQQIKLTTSQVTQVEAIDQELSDKNAALRKRMQQRRASQQQPSDSQREQVRALAEQVRQNTDQAKEKALALLNTEQRNVATALLQRSGRKGPNQHGQGEAGKADNSGFGKQRQVAGQELAALVPVGGTLILVDNATLGDSVAAGRRKLPFLERNGVYWGLPADDSTAIRELQRLRQDQGAQFIAFAWPSFWWLEFYKGFASHLRANFRLVLENDRLIVFELRS